MIVTYNTPDGHTVQCEVPKVRDAFEFLAIMSETFGITTCGHCKKNNIKRVHRKAQGFNFYELRCNDCGYQLDFGILQENERLFPRRKDKETKQWMDHDGWYKWEPETTTPKPRQQQDDNDDVPF